MSSGAPSSALSWPTAAHFSAAVQCPALCFRSPELKRITIATNHLKQPRVWSGQFANVYKAVLPDGRAQAVRVFTSFAAERRERYQAIAEYLKPRPMRSIVGFSYEEKGIRSAGDGKWYPLVTMDWVEGETLFSFVRAHSMNGNGKALMRLSDLWIELIRELAASQIAHGDLQHGNIMIANSGEMKLVDYDCMCVPMLEGKRNLEVGVDPYQHPSRDGNTLLSRNLDNFSALFILAALKALAVCPGLWTQYVEKDNYDKLLFRREDLREPGKSALMQSLLRCPDTSVAQLCRTLVELVHVNLDQVPRLEDVLFSWPPVESLLNRRDFDAALELVFRAKKRIADAPAAIQPKLRNAEERIKCRLDLEQAVQSGDERAMVRWYVPQLLDDYPRAQAAVQTARGAGQVLSALEQLEKACREKQWRQLVELWGRSQPLLSGRKSAQPFESLVGQWRERYQAWEAVKGLLSRPGWDPATVALHWTAARETPEAEPRRDEIDRMIGRARAWAALQADLQPGTPTEARDRQLVATWRENERWFSGWDEAERERPTVMVAERRLQNADQIRLLGPQSPTLATEQQIDKIGNVLPEGYCPTVQPRVLIAKERLHTYRRLLEALREPASDLEISKRWRALGKLQAQSLPPAEHQARIGLAEQRASVLALLAKIPRDYPPEQARQHDARLLAVWKKDLLDGCHDADPWREAHHRAVQFESATTRLRDAVAGGDPAAIVNAWLPLKHSPLPPELVAPVRAAVASEKAIRRLRDAVRSGKREQFAEAFDARILRANTSVFEPYAVLLGEWMTEDILPAEKLGLLLPVARKAISAQRAEGGGITWRICWNWPHPRFADECIVAVCRRRPSDQDDPRQIAADASQRISRKRYEDAGGTVTFPDREERLRGLVLVWALVDAGFQSFHSEPLILGTLEKAKMAGKKRRFL